jgi:copper homeostasis protein (lipoprotein)
MPAGLPGVYAGELPCSNCESIAATLWLRPDERFFLRQQYVDERGATDGGSYSLGRWHWDEQAAELVLHGAGPERRIAVAAKGRLRMRGASPVEHVLERDPAAPPFIDRITLQGDSRIIDKAAVFTECLTGLELAVAEENAFKELRRQHRVLNSRGKAALTSVEAHIVTITEGDATREVLVVDRVVGLKPGARC